MTVYICREDLEEILREDVGERWCFACRKRREFQYVVDAPVDIMSWYGPTPSIRCGECGKIDGDLFPGREREWTNE
jgi:hypothetical protein